MRRPWTLAVLFSLIAGPALANTPRLGLAQPAHGSTNWDVPLNANFGVLDSSAAAQRQPNTFLSSNTFLAPLLMPGTSVQLTGPDGYITGASSITANSFFGEGSRITNLSAANLTGSIPSSVLPSTIAYTSVPNVFTASQSVTGADGIGVTYGVVAGSVSVSGSQGFIISQSSITTSGTFFGDAGGLTGVRAGSLTNGPLAAGILPSTVAYTTASNTFVASQTITAAGGLGVTYGISGGSLTLADGLTASSGTFTASGAAQYSLQLSSSVKLLAGGVEWADGKTSTTSTRPGGVSGILQYNQGGAFGGAAQLYWDGSFFGVGRTSSLAAQLDIGNPTSSTNLVWRNSGGTIVGDLLATNGGSGSGEITLRNGSGSVRMEFAGGTDQNYILPTLNLGSTGSMPYQLGVTGDVSVTGEVLASSAVLSGNFFSVGGSTFVVTAGRVGITTAAPQATLDLGNGTFLTASSATASQFFGNGATIFGTVQSSATFIPQTAFTNTSFSACVATVTVTAALTSNIQIEYSGQMTNSNNAQSVAMTVLIDGAFPTLYSTAAICRGPAGSSGLSGCSADIGQTVAAGAHSFCMATLVTSATGTVYNDATVKSRFGVRLRP